MVRACVWFSLLPTQQDDVNDVVIWQQIEGHVLQRTRNNKASTAALPAAAAVYSSRKLLHVFWVA